MSEASEGVWKLMVGHLEFRRVEVDDVATRQRRTIRNGDPLRYRATLLPVGNTVGFGTTEVGAILDAVKGRNRLRFDYIIDPTGVMYDPEGGVAPFNPSLRGAVDVTPGQIQQLVAGRQQERDAAVAQKRALIERVRQWAKGGQHNATMVIDLGDIRQLVAMAERSIEQMEAEMKEQGR